MLLVRDAEAVAGERPRETNVVPAGVQRFDQVLQHAEPLPHVALGLQPIRLLLQLRDLFARPAPVQVILPDVVQLNLLAVLLDPVQLRYDRANLLCLLQRDSEPGYMHAVLTEVGDCLRQLLEVGVPSRDQQQEAASCGQVHQKYDVRT